MGHWIKKYYKTSLDWFLGVKEDRFRDRNQTFRPLVLRILLLNILTLGLLVGKAIPDAPFWVQAPWLMVGVICAVNLALSVGWMILATGMFETYTRGRLEIRPAPPSWRGVILDIPIVGTTALAILGLLWIMTDLSQSKNLMTSIHEAMPWLFTSYVATAVFVLKLKNKGAD